jgi:hypothetical protein
LQWLVSAYALTFGGLLLLGGRAADLFGRRRLFTLGLGLFAAASLLGGVAPNVALLVAARALQGVAAAILSPAALSLVTSLFQGRERHRALGIYGALGASGFAIGVFAGGLLTDGPGWRWVFLRQRARRHADAVGQQPARHQPDGPLRPGGTSRQRHAGGGKEEAQAEQDEPTPGARRRCGREPRQIRARYRQHQRRSREARPRRPVRRGS